MEDKIVVDLTGLDLSAEEKEQLQAHLQIHVTKFLQEIAKRPNDALALGPGWIGIEAK